MRKQRWTADDRRAFAEQPLRAQTIPSRRQDGPVATEWDDDDYVVDIACAAVRANRPPWSS